VQTKAKWPRSLTLARYYPPDVDIQYSHLTWLGPSPAPVDGEDDLHPLMGRMSKSYSYRQVGVILKMTEWLGKSFISCS
jgi:hypothetical protein